MLFILRFESRPEKRRELPTIHVFVGRFSGCVMAAGKDHYFVVEMVAGKLGNYLAREFRKKCQVIVCVDDQRLLAISGKFVEVNHWTGRQPQPAQSVEIDSGFHALANVPRSLPMPDHISEIGRRVIESINPNPRVVGAGNKSVTGTEARADQPELAIALLLQPVETTTNIDHALANRVQRPADVGRDRVVSATDLRRHTDVVVGHAQAKHG